jgi:type II secretory pathway pseudopilin PulG
MELMVVLTMLGVLAGVVIPPITSLAESWAVRNAHRRAAMLFTLARTRAQTSGDRTAVVVLPPHDLRVVRLGDTIARLELDRSQITLAGTRDSMAYSPSGMAWGASNLRLIFVRGAAADTLMVSRLGRVR